MLMTMLKLLGLVLLSVAVFAVLWHANHFAFWVGMTTLMVSVVWIVRSLKRGR